MKIGCISRKADVCPWCGAVESLRVYRTLRFPQFRRIVRYCTCKACLHSVKLQTRYDPPPPR